MSLCCAFILLIHCALWVNIIIRWIGVTLWIVTARVKSMYRFCLVCVCPSAKNWSFHHYITFYIQLGGGFGPIQACPFVHLCLSLPQCLGLPPPTLAYPYPSPRRRRVVQSSLELILVLLDKHVCGVFHCLCSSDKIFVVNCFVGIDRGVAVEGKF